MKTLDKSRNIEAISTEKSNPAQVTLAVSILWFSLASILLAFFVFASTPLKDFIFKEDALLENLSAVFYFIAAFAFFQSSRKQDKKHKLRMFWLLLFSALVFVVGCEEISWGQRIFGIATPEKLNEVNLQKEISLHNIDGIHQNIRLVSIFFMATLLCFIPWSNHYFQRANRFYSHWQFPIFPLNSVLVVIIAIMLMVLPRLLSSQAIYQIDETGEFFISLAWLIYAMSSLRNYSSLARNKII